MRVCGRVERGEGGRERRGEIERGDCSFHHAMLSIITAVYRLSIHCIDP